VATDAESPPRVAYAVGKNVGSAVARNRLRRRLRAVARELTLAPGAYLISAAPPAATMTFGELRDSVRAAAAAVTGEDTDR
jgi:ribonuclease P protein component